MTLPLCRLPERLVRMHSLSPLSFRASRASRGIYAPIQSDLLRKCVDPSTPLRFARDDIWLADSLHLYIKKPAPGIPGTVLQEPYLNAEAFLHLAEHFVSLFAAA